MNLIPKLPIGVENFEEIRTGGFYYIDKTGLITELLSNWGKVNLFTRPRRFGKSLNMSMLKYFFEYGCNPALFEGLAIATERELCEQYMGQYPVISITLKSVDAGNYQTARGMLCSVIGHEAMRFPFLKDSRQLTIDEKNLYQQLVTLGGRGESAFIMSDEVLAGSLRVLCSLLHKHYGQKAVLLIDEYDVPLDKAQRGGYYDEMISLVRNLLGQALKTNDSLQLAVLTGCLRITKESIFTGLNNLRVMSVTNVQFDEHFGFSDDEVQAMLAFYGLSDKYDLTKTWYNGYRFGNADVYCPWDVVNYVSQLRSEPDTPPCAFWANTSSNDVIRNFLRKATPATKRELERLMDGECIMKKIDQELTYRDLYSNLDNLWSVLFTTGYLTLRGEPDGKLCPLAIPNLEIKEIFTEQIMEWFQEDARRDTPRLDAFCTAFPKGDATSIEELFNAYLLRTISIRDTNVRKKKKENFYHGIILGLLSHREDWLVESNAESGEGYSDILVEVLEEGIGIVIEVKYAEDGDLEEGCAQALTQIEEKGYESKLFLDGMETVLKYGIACNRKRCKVRLA